MVMVMIMIMMMIVKLKTFDLKIWVYSFCYLFSSSILRTKRGWRDEGGIRTGKEKTK